jgi:hypothetical protein
LSASGSKVEEESADGLSAASTNLERAAESRRAMKPNQRIDSVRAHRCTWLGVAPALALILLTPPGWAAPEAQDTEESVPDSAAVYPDEQQLEMLVLDRYPQLATQSFAGIPVVTALLNHDGTMAATDFEVSMKDPGEVTVSALNFIRFGLKERDLSYMGIARFELPFTTVLIVYAEKRS